MTTVIPDKPEQRIRQAIQDRVLERIWDQTEIPARRKAREQAGEGFFWDELREVAEGAWSQAQEDNYDAG